MLLAPLPIPDTHPVGAPEYLRALAVNQAYSIPNTAINLADPADLPQYNSNYPGAAPWKGITQKLSAWNGMTFDSARHRIILGPSGGHNDYGGNDLHAIWLAKETPYVELWTAPSHGSDVGALDPVPSPEFGTFNDGLPRPSHTRGSTAYHPPTDTLVVANRSVMWRNITTGTDVIWQFDLSDRTPDIYTRALNGWTRVPGTGTAPLGGGSTAWNVYNPRDGLMYFMNGGSFGGFASYNPADYTLTVIDAAANFSLGPNAAACIVPGYSTKGIFVTFSFSVGWKIIDIADAISTGNAIGVGTLDNTAGLVTDKEPLTYDEVNDCIWSWQTGDVLVKIPVPADPINDTWTPETVAITGDSLPAPASAGMFNRMQYDRFGDLGFLFFVTGSEVDAHVVRVH